MFSQRELHTAYVKQEQKVLRRNYFDFLNFVSNEYKPHMICCCQWCHSLPQLVHHQCDTVYNTSPSSQDLSQNFKNLNILIQ